MSPIRYDIQPLSWISLDGHQFGCLSSLSSLRFLHTWRCRLAALLDGIDPPENMRRCFANNYDIEVNGTLAVPVMVHAGLSACSFANPTGVLAGLAL